MPCLTCDLEPCVCVMRPTVAASPSLHAVLYCRTPGCGVRVRMTMLRLKEDPAPLCRWCETGTAHYLKKKEQP